MIKIKHIDYYDPPYSSYEAEEVTVDQLEVNCDGNVIILNAEETLGKICDSQYVISRWSFDVQINIIEESGWMAIERNNEAYKMLNQTN